MSRRSWFGPYRWANLCWQRAALLLSARLVTLDQSAELSNIFWQPPLVAVVGELQIGVVQSRPDSFEQVRVVLAPVIDLVVHHPCPTLAIGQVEQLSYRDAEVASYHARHGRLPEVGMAYVLPVLRFDDDRLVTQTQDVDGEGGDHVRSCHAQLWLTRFEALDTADNRRLADDLGDLGDDCRFRFSVLRNESGVVLVHVRLSWQ